VALSLVIAASHQVHISSMHEVIASYRQIVGNGTVTANGTLSEISAVDTELFIRFFCEVLPESALYLFGVSWFWGTTNLVSCYMAVLVSWRSLAGG
jgi:hypothetical protein